MKFGVCLPHFGIPLDVPRLTEMAVKAEEIGYDSVWVTDHVIVPTEVEEQPGMSFRSNMLDPFTLLGHLGAVTAKVSIGTSVIILPYRNPIVVAKMLATTDVLSGGRVIFGAGVGWLEGEFNALGVSFAERGRASDEYLRLIKTLWTSTTPSCQGDYFQFSDVSFSPAPLQKPHPPIWVGGRSRAAVRRAVAYGDTWHPSLMGPEELAEKAAYMREYSASVGRDEPPGLTFRDWMKLDAAPISGERRALHGSIDQVADDVKRYSDAGVTHLAMDIIGDSYREKFEAMERFIIEVKPRLP